LGRDFQWIGGHAKHWARITSLEPQRAINFKRRSDGEGEANEPSAIHAPSPPTLIANKAAADAARQELCKSVPKIEAAASWKRRAATA
jgi:hypothetical protein